MKELRVEITDRLADAIDQLVQDGWFTSPADVTQTALREFLHRHRFELIERHQQDDIEWALEQHRNRS